jgi:hypothetical protein
MAVASLALALLAVACGGDDDATSKKDAAGADVADAAGGGGDDAAVDDSLARVDGSAADTAAGSDEAAGEDGGSDVGTADSDTTAAPQCETETDCEGKLAVQPCEQLACDAGLCKAVAKPWPSCCAASACDDKDECTLDLCDGATSMCVNEVDPKCCSGKQTLLKSGFEGDSWSELKAQDGATNGNVGWQLSMARARSGKAALYFGNACKTYDTSMVVEDGCKAAAGAQAVSTVLSTSDYKIPAATQTHLTFWLWLDAEPPYATSLKPATCAPGCPAGSTCVQLNGLAQCVVEKDVLTVQVVEGSSAQTVFSSTSIGKTSGGDWQRLAIDLSPWAGKNVKLQWQFQTGTGIKNGYEGIYLDDVVIETVCAQQGCGTDTPCGDDGNLCSSNACTAYANSSEGVCLYDKAPQCCLAAIDCDDGNACTVDSCTANLCSSVPDVAKAGCCKPSVLLYDGFDGGVLDGWTAQLQNSQTVQWRVLPTAGENGGALGFGDEAGLSYDDPNLGPAGPKGVLCSPPLALKAGTLYDQLSFKLRMDSEWSGLAPKSYQNPPVEGLPKFDHFAVLVAQGGALSEAWSSDLIYGSTGGNWQAVTVPLDKWQGQTVQVCLSFDAGDSSKNDFAGVQIDELAVKVACTQQACYLDSECAAKTCASACEEPKCAASGCACVAIAGCCTDAAGCDDGDACTEDACAGNACKHVAIPDCSP